IYTTSSYVRNHYFNIEDFSITFEFVDEIFFSNGEKLTSTDIYKTLYYQISHKTMFSSYLDFIEGVSEFLYDGKLNVEFGIYDIPERNMLVIKCNREVDYCDIFSNIEFSPVYFDDNGKPDIYISNGQFNLFVVKDYLVTLKRNKYVSSITNKNIMFVRFIVNNNLYYPIKLFHDGYIDVTSCTYFPNELVKYENIACKDSNIYFLLGFKEEFIQFKSIFFDIINNYINNNLSDILSPVRGYFLDNEIIYDFRAKKINKINFKKLKIAYLDYYPNKNIICVLSEYLLSMGFEVELYGFDIKS
ncbi:TPA: ABC transporter substrate-binding protein, partial [Mannheimia haemolytica]|nr:ABC transporter substrate-binding protein [Mannheimia haemolytica]